MNIKYLEPTKTKTLEETTREKYLWENITFIKSKNKIINQRNRRNIYN